MCKVNEIRVFPRKTNWTPDDEFVFIGDPPLFCPTDKTIPVKISVAFTWDIEEGERLYRAWRDYYSDVQLGGPAFGDPGGEFTPGFFIKNGVTITSRGCPYNCPFCLVPPREGKLRELEIKNGWIVQDNNLLACSQEHQLKVFKMLSSQKKPVSFSGGLDAKLLTKWHVDQFDKLKINSLWFACDSLQQEKYLSNVAGLIAHYSTSKKRCYVLVGFNGETISTAENRLNRIYEMGFLPFAQLYKSTGKTEWSKEWKDLQRKWCRPAAYKSGRSNINYQTGEGFLEMRENEGR